MAYYSIIRETGLCLVSGLSVYDIKPDGTVHCSVSATPV